MKKCFLSNHHPSSLMVCGLVVAGFAPVNFWCVRNLLYYYLHGAKEIEPRADRYLAFLGGTEGGLLPPPLIQLHFCHDVYGLYQLPTCGEKKKKKTELEESFIMCTNFIFIFFQTHEFPNILECLASPWSIVSWLSVKLWWFCGMRKIADSKLQNFWPYPLNF
jgi:hypothetical protein